MDDELKFALDVLANNLIEKRKLNKFEILEVLDELERCLLFHANRRIEEGYYDQTS